MKTVLQQYLKSPRAIVLLLVSFVASTVYTVLNARILMMISSIVDGTDEFITGVMILASICLVQTLLTVISQWTKKSSSRLVYADTTNRYMESIINADYALFTKYTVARLNTLGEFIGNIASVAKSTINAILAVITMGVNIAAIHKLAGNISFIVAIVYVVAASLMLWLFKVYGKYDSKIRKVVHKRNQTLENIINGFTEIRSFNRQERSIIEVRDYNANINKLSTNRAKIEMFIDGGAEVFDSIGLIIIIFYTVWLIGQGSISAPDGVALVVFVFRLMEPMFRIVDYIDTLSDQLKMAPEFDEVINWKNTIVDGDIDIAEFNRDITLKNVMFHYSDSSQVLNGIDMKIDKGKRIGICGSSGGGKTTIFKILNKFYEQNGGDITVDNISLKDISAKSWRRLIGTVHQDVIIFPGTIYDNISYACPDCTEHEVIEACKKAKLYDFIIGLKDRFKTEVGPRGLKLSGGQRQRIALARLFLQDPQIVLLDEATSALDNETELFIQQAISSLQGKTIITIAHRLTTIKDCDEIYVVDNGKVVEHGSHNELMAMGGIYSSMYGAKE